MNVEQFLFTLPYMAKGMAAIFIVTAVIICCIWLLNRLTKEQPKTPLKANGSDDGEVR